MVMVVVPLWFHVPPTRPLKYTPEGEGQPVVSGEQASHLAMHSHSWPCAHIPPPVPVVLLMVMVMVPLWFQVLPVLSKCTPEEDGKLMVSEQALRIAMYSHSALAPCTHTITCSSGVVDDNGDSAIVVPHSTIEIHA